MQQWEYHHEPASPTVRRLNELGREGWEYAGVVEVTTHRNPRHAGLLFKRPALTVESMFESLTSGASVDPALQ